MSIGCCVAVLVVLCSWNAGWCQARISLNLNKVDISDVLKTLSEQSDYNIAIGAGVSGAVTVYLDSVPVLHALEIVTELAGAAYVMEGKTIKVLSKAQYIEQYGMPPFDVRRLRVFELEFTPPADLVAELNKLKSARGLILTSSRTNSLYVLETPEVLDLMENIVTGADAQRGFRVYSLQYTTPAMLQSVLKEILTASAVVTPDVASNRLVVFDRHENLTQADQVVAEFDRPSHVETVTYQLRYADVAQITPHVQGLLTPNLGRVFSDAATNQVTVTDLPEVHQVVASALGDFDLKTPQVFIEARIVQVSLSDELRTGVSWEFVDRKLGDLGQVGVKGTFNVLSSSDQGLRFTSGVLDEDDYEFVLEMLEEVGKTDLLSTPRIAAINNREARILVGSSIPYKTIDTREENGTIRTFEKVTMVEVGVKLFVTPTINDSGFVTLDIRPEVSSVTGFTDGIPVVEKTEAETMVMVKDGVTLIIGGLIRNETRRTIKRIPLLGQIPLLGYLFSSRDNQQVKSELIIFITPHIITGEAPSTVPVEEP